MSRYDRKTSPIVSDLVMIWDTENSDWRLTTITAILALATDSSGAEEATTQYYAPTTTDFTIAITNDDEDIHLIMTPTGTLAAGTITLPSTLRDKQKVIVNSTNEITSLTVSGNGATVNGAPDEILANGYFTLKYDLAVDSWYRIA